MLLILAIIAPSYLSNDFGLAIDFATVKYNSSGVEQWVARYNALGGIYNNASALAVDDQGNVYVTGVSVGMGTGNDYVTINYGQN